MSKTIKIIIGIIIVIIVIGGIWWGVSRKPVEEKVIKIGIIGHFSGDYASYSIPMKNAIELAVEEVNKSGSIKEQTIKLFIEDDGSSSNNAASGMNKLINIDKVNYILSAQGSGATSVITPIAQNNKRILMITLASAPGLTNAGEYIFRSVPSDVYQGIKMAEFVNDNLKPQKVAGLYVNDAYGMGIKGLIKDNVKSQLVTQEVFDDGASDFRTQLTKIKNSNPDVLVLVSRKETPNILKQVKELGMDNIKIIASETVKDEEILQKSGDSAEGIYIAFMADPEDYVEFSDKYKNKYNEDPSAYSMYAYDGVIALINAIKKQGDNTEVVKSILPSISFKGASGQFSLDEDRERVGMEYVIYTVKNGEFVPYEE